MFERLCLDFAKARISPNFVSPTGPVGADGDQGQDFETFVTFVAAPRGAGSTPRAVGICSLTTSDPEDKVRNDLAKIATGEPVDVVYAFLEADMPVAKVHRLTAEAHQQYGFALEVFNGNRLAEQLAAPDLTAIASRWLAVPSTVLRSAATADDAALRWADEMWVVSSGHRDTA